MKILILHGESLCSPCDVLIKTIEELAVKEPQLNLSYETFVKGTPEAQLIIDEHLNRGFSIVGAPLWILYDEDNNYVKTFLGFFSPDSEHDALERLKQGILLNNTEFDHQLAEFYTNTSFFVSNNLIGEEYEDLE